ncbi:MAG: hypothetical protein MJ184_03040 [Treponema sp.]|uniref:hypothetical protein n=1 Tax=Treponema sp. TaxID=166 RepID=UPI00298E2FF2|nr:hypothetical protein [Treponema sp.]MCQ2600317.1 hypothetical protein [Treponema sp.]
MQNTINNKLCLYLVLNYLKTRYSKEAYRDYLLEREIETLEYIAAWIIAYEFCNENQC